MRKRQKDEALLQRRWRVILAILLGIGCMLSGCNSPLKFEKSKDEINTTYKNEHIEIQIANNVENPEDIFKSIEKDLNTIHAFEPIDRLEIIVEQNPPRASKENQVLIQPNVVSADNFRKELIAKAYNLYDQWKVEGIYGNLFSNQGEDKEKRSSRLGETIEKKNQAAEESMAVNFQSYFQKNEFSLFSLRFDEEYSSKEGVENLQAASTDLVKYLLAQGKQEQLVKEEITMDDIKAWASEYEISTKYLESIYSHIENIRTGTSWMFLCPEIKTKRETNGFTINLLDRYEKYDTAKELEQIIKTFDEDIANNLRVIREQAPNFYKEYEKPLTEVPRIMYKFEYKHAPSYVQGGGLTINLRDIDPQMAEYNHILLQQSFREHGIMVKKPLWIWDGLDVCLFKLYSSGFGYKEWLEVYLKFSQEKLSEDYPVRKEIYLKNLQKIIQQNFSTKEETFDNLRNRKKLLHIIDGRGIYYGDMLKIPGYEEDTRVGGMATWLVTTNQPKRVYGGIEEPNNNHAMANYSFVAYLLEEYGLEKMLYFGVQDFSEITFEEYFGKSYKELDADWKQYLIDNIKGGEFLVYGEKGKP